MKPITPYKTGLDVNSAYWMARIAKTVYLKRDDGAPDEAAILAALQQDDEQFKAVVGASKSSAQGVLIEHQNYLCLAFRGTDEGADWLDNLNLFPVKEIFGEFHRGFWNSVSDLWEALFGAYQAAKRQQPRPLFLTGHSLGGAMATIAAARLIHQDLPFTSAYTFGQPRAMSLATARIFNSEAKGKFFRFQNNNDIVTRAPARIMGYSHVGSYLYIAEDGRLFNDPGFWLRFLDMFEGAFEAVSEKGIDAVEDHSMDKYLFAINKWDCGF